MMLLFLLFLLKGDSKEAGLSSFSKWNWISLLSLTIIICIAFLMIFQFFFRAKTVKSQPRTLMDSSIFYHKDNLLE